MSLPPVEKDAKINNDCRVPRKVENTLHKLTTRYEEGRWSDGDLWEYVGLSILNLGSSGARENRNRCWFVCIYICNIVYNIIYIYYIYTYYRQTLCKLGISQHCDALDRLDLYQGVVCMMQPRRYAFTPCGHRCVCHICAVGVTHMERRCPICRAKAPRDVTSLVISTGFSMRPSVDWNHVEWTEWTECSIIFVVSRFPCSEWQVVRILRIVDPWILSKRISCIAGVSP